MEIKRFVDVALRCRQEVESCEKWAHSTTQQVDLAFNIFFMIYFFIRVSSHTLPSLDLSCCSNTARVLGSIVTGYLATRLSVIVRLINPLMVGRGIFSSSCCGKVGYFIRFPSH